VVSRRDAAKYQYCATEIDPSTAIDDSSTGFHRRRIEMITEELPVTTLDEDRERLVSPAPVLISEREVMLGTAIALQPVPAKPRRRFEAIYGLLSAARRSLATTSRDERPVRRDYPKRYSYLEDACMARAMERL
jgi:hypothetical protein